MNNNLLLACLFFLMTSSSAHVMASIPIEAKNASKITKTILGEKDKRSKSKKVKSTKASNALLFGILGMVLFPPLGILAIIYGSLSITNHEPEQKLAVWGLVLGGLATLYTLAITDFLISGI